MANEREELLIRDRVTQQPRPYYVHADNINLGDENNYQGLPAKLQQMTQDFTPDTALDSESTKPIQNKVVKAAIDAINRAIDQLVGSDDVTTYIDSFNEVITFLAGVTNNETLTAKLYELQQAIDSKQATLTFDDAPTQSSDNMVKSGGIYSALADKANADETYTKTAVDEMVETLRQAGTAIVTLEKTRILDEHDNNTVLAAPSARQMALAAANIETLFTKVNDLYDKLAGIAFTDGKPANWKVNADWVGDGVTQYTLSFGTLSGIDSVKDRYGNTIDTSTTSQVNEGYLKLILKPSSASHVFTSILVNGDAVQATPVSGASDGSVYIEITVAGNVTVAATAISGRGIDFTGSTGCTIDDAGVPNGEDLDTTIRANEHFTLPASITVKVGTSTLSPSNYIYTRASGNATATLFIDEQHITDDLTIICEAVEDKHVVLNLSNVGSGVTVKQGNVTLQNDAHIYHGDAAVTLTIETSSTKKFDDKPTASIGGTSATVGGDSIYGSYTLEIATSVADKATVAITASVDDRDQCTIGFADEVENFTPTFTKLDGTSLPAGSVVDNVATIYEGNGIKIVLTPSSNHRITVGTITMGSDTLVENTDYTVTDNNGVKTIAIASVTGKVVITAVAEEVGKVTISKSLRNVTLTDNADGNNQINEGTAYSATITIDDLTTAKQKLDGTGTTKTGLPALVIPSNGVVVKVGGIAINGAFDSTNNTISIPASSVTDDITIEVTAESTVIMNRKLDSDGEKYATAQNGSCYTDSYLKIPSTTTHLVWKHCASSAGLGTGSGTLNTPIMSSANPPGWTKKNVTSINTSVDQQTIDVSSSIPSSSYQYYLIATFALAQIANCYIKAYTSAEDAANDTNGTVLFDGAYATQINPDA